MKLDWEPISSAWLFFLYKSTCNLVTADCTWGLSDTYFAQWRMRRIASILVSGNAALQANSDKHFTASWKESMVAGKCFSNTIAERKVWTGGKKCHALKSINSNMNCISYRSHEGLAHWLVLSNAWVVRKTKEKKRIPKKQKSPRGHFILTVSIENKLR